ncbi:class I SAM-dependent methyltransferase [Erythrobacter sp. GH1-10]|uniref:class I SAM-dependent methyltransferase n=1 Tax=Erythrobacter sp. GH1-10 TaxID=3349334 RepID=UPI003877C205
MDLVEKFRKYSGKYGVVHAALAGVGRKAPAIWQATGPIVSRSYVLEYCRREGPRGLNLGSGSHCIDGMLNVDIDPRADAFVDLTKPLPLPDACFDVIFTEEVIEHVDEAAGARLLDECFRVLKPGGVIHVATPCLEYFGARVANEDSHGAEINQIFYEHGHRFIYSRPRLTAALEQAGFEAVRFYKYKDPEALLGRYDSHAARFDHDPAISHHVEASKPGSAANLGAFTSDA